MPTLRPIVTINEERCTGCGDCILACAESAIEIIDGKARLVGENLCDGFGACLGTCPEDAIAIEERKADAFDEEAVSERIASLWISGQGPHTEVLASEPDLPCAQVVSLDRPAQDSADSSGAAPAGPVVSHWPIKLSLVPPTAPFLQGADLVLMADCVPFAAGERYRAYLSKRALVIGCPKFDDFEFALNRLTDIVQSSNIRSLTIVHMEVPCCGGYWHLGQQACAKANPSIPVKQVVIGVNGEVREDLVQV